MYLPPEPGKEEDKAGAMRTATGLKQLLGSGSHAYSLLKNVVDAFTTALWAYHSRNLALLKEQEE